MTHIRVDDVGLDVPLFVQSSSGPNSWIKTLTGAAFTRPRREYVTLLEGISFEAHEGDRIALLGRNGAGKSTLLQVLSGAYQPTRGSVDIQGTRQALMNMSLGFNPEATVAENVLLRGSAMGLTLAQAREKYEEIIDFADLGHKATHRLKTLSSGQRMRLGFAISTCTQHDIMLLDEWIGASDAEFIEKATDRMLHRMGDSKIVVLATHSLSLVRKVCNRAILIDQGRVKSIGSVSKVVAAYKDRMRRHAFQARKKSRQEATMEAGSRDA